MLPWWLSSKESVCNAGAAGDTDSISGSGSSPAGGHGNPLQYSCLENPREQKSLVGHGPQRLKELDMTEVTSHTCTKCYSCYQKSTKNCNNKTVNRDFSGGLAVKTLCFHPCRGHGFHPWSGN